MTETVSKLIGKYAWTLAVMHLISFAFGRLMIEVRDNFDFEILTILTSLPLAFGVLLNLVAAFMVRRDVKKYGVGTRYVMLATIVYRPLGIFAFLMFFLLSERKAHRIA
jgi:hypothetical protein